MSKKENKYEDEVERNFSQDVYDRKDQRFVIESSVRIRRLDNGYVLGVKDSEKSDDVLPERVEIAKDKTTLLHLIASYFDDKIAYVEED